ncbi:hypothetical protein NEUTE1DRAFT_101814 [Neurospora tetrasperma FGSC 2508]|uniref:Uncharacterized protein n=1 Tax=Neurospora tetrasperma (strain FGSC 2508 / ATCC MYA-4615 / P0657) TaxID=510951 RepID=F8MQA5_NEUT8|nr:uncharacterized protein NEUTE1DRAFT_101814 [Neurospora tetrasperma FGSC 2508]EGO56535.1 hypothetical protein NEUTE1DRAFT_101814 [Neurospora tetrasperma FGSC 2508]
MLLRWYSSAPIAIFPYRAHAVVVLSFDRPATSDIDKTPSPTAGEWAAGGDWKIPAQDPPRARAPREAGAGPTKCARGITTKVGSTLRFHLVTTEFPCRPFLLSRHDREKIDAKLLPLGLFLGEWLVTPVSEQAWRFVPSWEWSSAGSSGKYVSSGLSVVSSELVRRKREWEGKKGGGQRSNNWKAGPDVRKVESAQEREKKKRIEERKGTEDGKGGRGARGNLNDRSDFLWSAVGLLQVKKMAVHGDGKCNLEAREGPCPTGSGRA